MISLNDPSSVTVLPASQLLTAPAPPATPIGATPTASVPAPAPTQTGTPVTTHYVRPWRIIVAALALVGLVFLVRKL